jgi:hypothetical protein
MRLRVSSFEHADNDGSELKLAMLDLPLNLVRPKKDFLVPEGKPSSISPLSS